MSWGAVDMEWLVMVEMDRLAKKSDGELVERLKEVAGQGVTLKLVGQELDKRGMLNKVKKEYPELWV